MFRIRKSQFEALDDAAERNLRDQIVAELRDGRDSPARQDPLPEVQSIVEKAIRQARNIGCENDQAVALFCLAAFLLGPDFANEPSMAEYLASADEKEDLLADLIDELDRSAPGDE